MKTEKSRYLLELVLLDSTTNKKWLLSEHVMSLNEKELCRVNYLQENQQAPINFVTVYSDSNQLSVRSLIHNLWSIQEHLTDRNVGLVVVDNTSEDVSRKAIVNLLEMVPSLNQRLVIRSQVSAIEGYNVALHHIKDDNSIVFPIASNVEIIDAAVIDEIQQVGMFQTV